MQSGTAVHTHKLLAHVLHTALTVRCNPIPADSLLQGRVAEYKDGKHLIKFEDGEETVSFGCLMGVIQFFCGTACDTCPLPPHF